MTETGNITMTDTELTYRAMTVGDIDGLVERLYARFDSSTKDKKRKKYEAYCSEIRGSKGIAAIATADTEIAGYVTMLREAASGTPFREEHIPQISDLFVFEDFRERGVGTGLMDYIERQAASINNAVCLGVGLTENNGAAQRLFVRRGYIPDGSGVWYGRQQAGYYTKIDDVGSLMLYMSKPLND
ncbi:N-acetyltransferase [Clostridia bacterium]|nr:N-acetyltransferase [Clostridia bacterium]